MGTAEDNKIKIGMWSVADSVKGQGVGSAYSEQMKLLDKMGGSDMEIHINKGLRKCDLIHCHTIDPIGFIKVATTRKPCIMSVHFVPKTMDGAIKLPRPILKLFNAYIVRHYKNADLLHVVNPSFADDLVELGISREKIKYIPNVVSLDGFHPRDEKEREEIRARYGLSPDDFVVIGCGQVQTKKGVHSFAEVAKMLPDVRFVWVGGFSFGNMSDGYSDLKKLMDAPPPNLTFTGIVSRDEVSALMGASDVFFLPSFHELCCMAVLEAAGTGLPILLRDLDSYGYLYPGLYMKAEDDEGFAEHIRMLRDDKETYSLWASRSEEISHIFSEENIYAMWKEYYSSVREQDR